jgi:tRNA pseudouridine38-40 synthase
MQKAAVYFIGKHDFSTFMSEGSDITDCVRTVFDLSVSEKDGLIEIRISADGFLYNMVRIIVGTLMEIAYGRFSPEDVPGMIAARDRSKAGMTAPPFGLYLNKVVY